MKIHDFTPMVFNKLFWILLGIMKIIVIDTFEDIADHDDD